MNEFAVGFLGIVILLVVGVLTIAAVCDLLRDWKK